MFSPALGMVSRSAAKLAAVTAGALLVLSVAGANTGQTTRVSVAADGTQGNDFSFDPSVSGDGRIVAFHSIASNLVAGDSNGAADVFVHDRQTGRTTRVSVASDGTQGNRASANPSVSSDGRTVAFLSFASNLVAGDSNGAGDVFVHDRQTGQTTRVSVAADGTQGNGLSLNASVSSDGRTVAFESIASNLVAGDSNGFVDVFVHDLQTGQTTRVSVASDGTQGNGGSSSPSVSSDGRTVAFESIASNLVAGDSNGAGDVFVHDLQTGQTTRISVAADGTQGNSESFSQSVSDDGRTVAFQSFASNLVAGDTNDTLDIFVHDRRTGQTTRVSVAADGTQGNSHSLAPSVSGNGRTVAFGSHASNLVAGDSNGFIDVFVHDRQTGQTTRVSVAADGTQGNSGSDLPKVSGDGRTVAFRSFASNLVAGDSNGVFDVFVHERFQEPAEVFGGAAADPRRDRGREPFPRWFFPWRHSQAVHGRQGFFIPPSAPSRTGRGLTRPAAPKVISSLLLEWRKS